MTTPTLNPQKRDPDLSGYQWTARSLERLSGKSFIECGAEAGLYIATDSGTIYRLCQEGQGKLVIRDSRGRTACYVDQPHLASTVIEKGKQFDYGVGTTSPVAEIVLRQRGSPNGPLGIAPCPLRDEFLRRIELCYQADKMAAAAPPAPSAAASQEWSKILGRLNIEEEFLNLPAHKILAKQVDRIFAHCLSHKPDATPLELTLSTASRFLEVELYQRIAQQRFFGIKGFESCEDESTIEKLLPGLHSDLQEVERITVTERPWLGVIKENGWLYVTDQRGHELGYRIYLSPEASACGSVLKDLLREIPPGVPFQLKTFDQPSASEAARVDKIIIYATEESAALLYEAVRKTHRRHERSFLGRLAPGGGTCAPLPGVSIAREPKLEGGEQSTGTMEVSKYIEARLYGQLSKDAQALLSQLRGVPNPSETPTSVALWGCISNLKGFWAIQDLSDESRAKLDGHFVHSVWSEIIMAAAEGRPRSADKVRRGFKELVSRDRSLYLSGPQKSDLFSNLTRHIDEELLQPRLQLALRRMALTKRIFSAVEKGARPGEGYLSLVV